MVDRRGKVTYCYCFLTALERRSTAALACGGGGRRRHNDGSCGWRRASSFIEGLDWCGDRKNEACVQYAKQGCESAVVHGQRDDAVTDAVQTRGGLRHRVLYGCQMKADEVGLTRIWAEVG